MKTCPRCNASCKDFVVLADHLGGQILCEYCFKSLIPLMDENNLKWEEKKRKAEVKILKKHMNYSNNNCLWFFLGFIALIIILIILNSG